MKLQISKNEPLSVELKRTVLDFSGEAIESLHKISANPQDAIHESRKATRSARALLRLYKKSLEGPIYEKWNGMLRHAAQLLSPHRDAHVQLAVIDELIQKEGRERELHIPLHEHIVERFDIMTGSFEDAVMKAEELLKSFSNEIVSWSADQRNAKKKTRKSLVHAFKRTRKKFKKTSKIASPERLHELRKRSKDMREQLRFLMPLAPEKISQLEGEFDDLCDQLGKARDLYLVRELLVDIAKNWPDGKPLIAKLQDRALEKENKYTRNGLKSAQKAIAHSPKSIKQLIK